MTDMKERLSDLDELWSLDLKDPEVLNDIESTIQQALIQSYSLPDVTQREQYRKLLNKHKERLQRERKIMLVGEPNRMTSTPRLETGDRLKESLRQLHESEAIAHDTLTSLRAQGEVMKKTQAKLKDVGSETGHSNTLLNRMLRFWRG